MKTERFPQLAAAKDEIPMSRSSTYPMTMTDPLPSCYRPPSPPGILASQPPCTQLTMYRYSQYINYYHEMQLKHQKEFEKLAVKRQQDNISVPCYTRTFPSIMSVTPPGSPQNVFIFPEMNMGYNENNKMRKVVDTEGFKKEGYEQDLGSLLAELRMNTMQVDG